ncbi:hypothetical protein QBC34DRAFT_383922 [Podospora aff. communis PSN243]|uniref:Uncharacterized protein n=1 Tax=Podospora aff. communis PSN243 TaxID=3040156 RepID=A0AAV9GDN4_9PEZI|nr:hypothetical protein QBC34DRAFT_383922 [Podospora aff. communis PSN243]
MWLTTGSLLTKYVVQNLVWQWVSIWLFIAMFCFTLAFSGFFTGNLRADSYPRLVVILMYLVGFATHTWYVWTSTRRFFTLVAAGAMWSLLNKASFAAKDLGQLENRLAGKWPDPVFRHLGRVVKLSGGSFPALSNSYRDRDNRP